MLRGQKTLCALIPHPAGGTVFGQWGQDYPVTCISSPGRNRSGYLRSGLFCGKVLCGMFLCGKHLTELEVHPVPCAASASAWFWGWARLCREDHSYASLTAFGNLPWVKFLYIQPSPSWAYLYFQLGVIRSISLLTTCNIILLFVVNLLLSSFKGSS